MERERQHNDSARRRLTKVWYDNATTLKTKYDWAVGDGMRCGAEGIGGREGGERAVIGGGEACPVLPAPRPLSCLAP